MTDRLTAEDLCGIPHYDYPESTCTQPAGHYQRGTDPHAAPLIIDGRECGAAAWDEPETPPMTNRLTASRPLCACGCGQMTPLATRTDPRFGHVAGQPTRYVKGHRTLRRASRPLLSPGQLAALRLAANGMTSRQIATVLGSTEQGIHLRLTAAAANLGARSRIHAVAIALTRGLIRPDEIALPADPKDTRCPTA